MKYWLLLFFILVPSLSFADEDEHIKSYRCNNTAHTENLLFLAYNTVREHLLPGQQILAVDIGEHHSVVPFEEVIYEEFNEDELYCEVPIKVRSVTKIDEQTVTVTYNFRFQWKAPELIITFEQTFEELGKDLDDLNRRLLERFYRK